MGAQAAEAGIVKSPVLSKEAPAGPRLHPWPVRVMHWTNVIAMFVMVGSGWGIYDDSVIFHVIYFPKWLRLGHWAAESLLWHFAGMWLLMANGAAYLIYGLATGRLRARLLPIRVQGLIATVKDTLRFKLAHDDLTVYNPVQKLLYIVVIAAGGLQVVTGLAVWKPVQLKWIIFLLGGFQNARLFHFLGMSIIVGFIAVHVLLALLAPRTLLAMLTGGPRLSAERAGKERG